MPPPFATFKYKTVEPPKSPGDVPRYLKELLGGFFRRFLYLTGIVWDTGHWILFLLIFIALFQGIMPAVGLKITQQIQNALQDAYMENHTVEEFFASAAFMFLVFMFVYRILNSVISHVNNAVMRLAGELVVKNIKLRIMRKASELDLSSFDLPAFYEKLENANREAGNRPLQILSSSFNMLSAIISFVTYIIILLTLPSLWWSIFVVIAVSVPSAIINFKFRKKNFNYMRFRSKSRRQMNYYADIMVNKDMVKEIRMFDLSSTFISRYSTVFDSYFKGIRSLTLRENAWHILSTVIMSVTNCVFFCLIAIQVFSGQLKVGDYSLLTGALTSIAGAVGTFISTSATIYEGSLFIDNLISYMDEKPCLVPTLPEPAHVAHGGHTIEFRNVSFSYPGTDRQVIRNINLYLRPGETVVLVGLNGAGKTTLIKLLTRLYDPTEGVILLDGRDIREYDLKELYRLYGIIFQDFGKYAETVTENIHYGNIHKEVSEEEIRDAAEQADAGDYINRLPKGFETPLMRIFEEDGLELSIGQWQKLANARAFYADSEILILDEPTASLDPLAEQEIFNQFDRLRKEKTTIFVSHRLSSATIATKIVVLEYGAVIEEGTHPELMQKHGRYYELFTTQAKRYVEGDSAAQSSEDHPHSGRMRRRNTGMPQESAPDLTDMPDFQSPPDT
ncbi:MAG: ABC transporter ATP-binding protein [Clostridia bacterium]|nr:ABC transporter ATP-binding protein [Clostridia bacterium]